MFSSITHFKAIWQSEATATVQCIDMLNDAVLQVPLIGEYRTIQRLVNHLIACADGIPWEAGLPVTFNKQVFTTVASMKAAYLSATDRVLKAIDQWSDATLAEDVTMYGENWTKGYALWVTVIHQIHHRGQLTTLMRLAGLKVPGIYGPNKEEWEAYNLPQAD